jgi:hypothetical protein
VYALTAIGGTVLAGNAATFLSVDNDVRSFLGWFVDDATSSPLQHGVEGARGIVSIGPNPIRNAGWVAFAIPSPALAQIDVVDVTGRIVDRLLPRTAFATGSHRVQFERGGLAPGVYFLRMESAGRVDSRKVMIAPR